MAQQQQIESKDTIISRVIAFMERLLGNDYSQSPTRYDLFPGGAGDCSSYVDAGWQAAGYPFRDADQKLVSVVSTYQLYLDPDNYQLVAPSTAKSTADIGKKYFDARDYSIEKGDIIFYGFDKNTSRKNKITHVALAYSSTQIIHTSNNREKACIKPMSYGAGYVLAVLRLRPDHTLTKERTSRRLQLLLNTTLAPTPALRTDGVVGSLTKAAMTRLGAATIDQAWEILDPQTIQPTPEIPEPTPAPSEPTLPTYTVQRGDSLSKIARAYHTTVGNLQAWNNIKDADLIYVGQKLVVAQSDGPIVTPTFTRLLRKGDSGEDVKLLQTSLNTMASAAPYLEVDGIFGSRTDSAIRSFQTSNLLTVDGVLGPKTAAALGIRYVPTV